MKDKFDAVIVADGDFPTTAYPLQVLADANFIACCDGAIKQLEQCGINPDIIVGDCDSISLQLKEKFADRIYHIEEQDDNDLTTTNPKLASEWNYDKNGDLKPEDFTANSGKKVWWKCAKGHEWQATVGHRNRGRGCPYCAGRKMKQI